jgi:hypothetical protein
MNELRRPLQAMHLLQAKAPPDCTPGYCTPGSVAVLVLRRAILDRSSPANVHHPALAGTVACWRNIPPFNGRSFDPFAHTKSVVPAIAVAALSLIASRYTHLPSAFGSSMGCDGLCASGLILDCLTPCAACARGCPDSTEVMELGAATAFHWEIGHGCVACVVGVCWRLRGWEAEGARGGLTLGQRAETKAEAGQGG